MIRIKSITKCLVAGVVAILLFAGAPAFAADATAVKIGNFTFGPQELKVKAGTTVTWTNEDDMPHTVVSPNNFRSKVLDTDGTYAFTFTTPGTYKYFCSLHPHMTGTIVVEAATGSINAVTHQTQTQIHSETSNGGHASRQWNVRSHPARQPIARQRILPTQFGRSCSSIYTDPNCITCAVPGPSGMPSTITRSHRVASVAHGMTANIARLGGSHA